ncbi:MAG: FmdB family zinc ribbon protein [bacterium]
MPTYEYACNSCSHKFEKFQGISDPPLKRCPKCKHKVRRLLGGGGGLIFKGSGFYTTDYRSDSYKKSQSAESIQPADKKSSAGDSAKPAAKKEASVKSSGSSSK